MKSPKRHRSKRLAIFNHKGGVGKTTLTVNTAQALVLLGKKVLLVDSDPQCNLTSYLMESAVVDDLLDASETDEGKTLWSALKPISDGTGDVKVLEPNAVGSLYFIPGDILLSKFEQELYQSWGDCFQRKMRGYRGTCALSLFVNEVAAKLNVDFVFYDSGPNIGPLNRVILLDCDGFIVPAACDYFSIRALKTLGETLYGWITDWKTVLALAPDDTYLLPGKPVLLGYLPQRFRVYGGNVTSDFAKFLPRIDKRISSDVGSKLREIDKELSPLEYQSRLGLVRDFGKRAVLAQEAGVSIWEIGADDEKLQAKNVFVKIAEKIIQRAK